ncbi:hypothetical protein F5887DRAFT_1074248 [Amanita rubescens]|nr:hypothetical protein F5887DRAFT_1074248 [Amanita rubescens]
MSFISPALFFFSPLFLLFLSLAHRPTRVHLHLFLIALLALLTAILGLTALKKAETIFTSFFVFALESSSLYIILSLSSYHLYVSALFLLLSSATLLSLISTLLPLPSAISPALLVLFSLLSFPILSYLIFPPKDLSARGAPLNSSRTPSRLTTSLSLIPFPSLAPSASSATTGAFSPIIASEKLAQGRFFEVDLEGPSPPNHNNSSTTGTLSIVPVLLLVAQFLFLLSCILDICATSSALETSQTAILVVSSLLTTFSYSQYVRDSIRDRIPEQANESCGSSDPTNPYAKGVYTNINSTNDATVPASQHSLSPNASMSFSLDSAETFHVNGQAASKGNTCLSLSTTADSSRLAPVTAQLEPTIGPVPLWIRTDDATIHYRAGTNRDGATAGANDSAANDINFIYMPTPVRTLPPSLLFPDDNSMGAATMADLRQNAPRQPISDVASDVAVATHFPATVSSKKPPTLVHKHSAWSISSSSAASIPIVTSPTPFTSSSTLALSGICMKPRSQTLSTASSRQLLAKCVPLDVLSRKMETAKNGSPALRPGVSNGEKVRRDPQQPWLRVDNGIGSRCRSISAASSFTAYEDPRRVTGGKEKKKRGGFIFGGHSQGSEERQDKIQDDSLLPDHGPRSQSLFNHQGVPSIRRAMRGRSLSISLLSNLIGLRKSTERDEDANEPITPSSSVSISRSSLLSSLSMSLSRSPASPTSPPSPRTPGSSEPGSPTSSRNGHGKKNSLYYWTYRKVKKDVSSCAVSDLHQGMEQGGDNERVGLMEDEGPPDFMDLTDPFAPPDLGTRGFMTTACSADEVLLGKNKSTSKSSMWGRLPVSRHGAKKGSADGSAPGIWSRGDHQAQKFGEKDEFGLE